MLQKMESAGILPAQSTPVQWRMFRIAAWFFIISFIYAFNMWIHPISKLILSEDTFSNSILPFSILLHHDVFLGRYLNGVDISTAYYVRPFHGNLIPSYPIGPALTALPTYLLYLAMGGQASLSAGLVVGKLAAIVIASISVLLFYKLLTDLGLRARTRIVFTIIYAFGSETFSIGSQALWQHGPAELWIILFLLGSRAIIMGEPKSVFVSYLTGFASGMLLLSRPQDIIITIPFFLFVVFSSKRRFAWHAIPVFMVLALFNLWYNMHFYTEPTLRGGPTNITHILSAPFLIGLLGNLISPSRGLFVFMPWAVLSFAWLFSLRKRSFYRTVYAPALFSILLYIAMYSKLGYWAAGFSFGPRYMTDIAPLLAVLAAGFWNQWRLRQKIVKHFIKVTFTTFAAWSIIVQALGTYVLGFEWNVAALPDTFSKPLWSVQYSEIPYYFQTLKASFSPVRPLTNPQAKFLTVRLLAKPNIYTQGTVPAAFKTSTRYSGTALVQNTGAETWSVYPAHGGKGSISFSYSIWSQGRLLETHTSSGALLHSVRPGQQIEVYFYFRTPSEPGQYTYVFTLTQGKQRSFQTQLSSHNASLQSIMVE